MREPGRPAPPSERPLTIADYEPARRRIVQVDWPGTTRKVSMLYLHCSEIQSAYFTARKWFADQGQAVDEASATQFELEMRYQLLQRMLLAAPDPQRKLLPTVEALRKALAPNKVSVLIERHNEIAATEAAAWAGELLDPAMRRIAQLLGLGVDALPEVVVEAVERLQSEAAGG